MPDFSSITINLGVVMGFLYGLVGAMLIVVLYHLLFIVVDLRRIVRRFESMTEQVETTLLKPLSIADKAVQFILEFIEHKKRDFHRKHAAKAAQDHKPHA